MTDLHYILSKDEEKTITQLSGSSDGYTIEILTPRRYVGESAFYETVNFSDILIYYSPSPEGYSFDIFIINDDLDTNDLRTLVDEVTKKTKEDFLDKNKSVEGLHYMVSKLVENLNRCSVQLSVPQDNPFTPGIDNDKLEVTVKSECTDYKHFKFEVFPKESTEPIYSKSGLLSELKDEKFLWDGKVEGQAFKFIRAADADLVIKVSLSKEESFSSAIMGNVQVKIDVTVDEWNKHKAFFDGYVVKNNYPGSNYEFYANTLREVMVETIPQEYLTGKSPLDYMSENLEKVEFLGATFVSHKKFTEKLRAVENRLKLSGDYNNLKQTYKPLINGSFALRLIANRRSMSPHSLAAAIDIDPNRNPHIKDEWGRQVFEVIKFISDVNMYGNTPSVADMKTANSKFKKHFNADFIAKLELQSGLTIEKVSEIVGKLKYEGEFDKKIMTLVLGMSEAAEKYYQVTPAYTQEGRALEAQYLEEWRSWITRTSELQSEMETYFNTLPSFSFSPIIESRMEANKETLRLKIKFVWNARDKPRTRSLYADVVSLNDWHWQSNLDAVSGEFSEEALSQSKQILQYVNNQKSRLTKWAASGFFELDELIVKAFLDESNVRWGGNYRHEKDFMHFELYPLKKGLE